MKKTLLLAAVLVAAGTAAASTAPTVVSVVAWRDGAQVQAWAGGRVYFNQHPATSHVFDGYSAAPDGSASTCLTCGMGYPAGTQHGVSDVSPDGRYALVTVERCCHWPYPDGDPVAAPGRGTYNDLYLQATDKSATWRLVNLAAGGTNALIWPRFDATGTRIVWSEQHTCCVEIFGWWTLHVADLRWTNGVPSLANVKSFSGPTDASHPKGMTFYEPYGFSPDGSKILFAANNWTGGGTTQDNDQIDTMASSLTGPVTRLSPHDTWCNPEGWWCPYTNYNEFAFYMPGRDRIIFAREVGAYHGSLEYWTMNPDGTDPRQLTHLSAPAAPGMYVVGGLAFDPGSPSRFITGYAVDGTYDNYSSAVVTLSG